jgi:hypothetical protein
MNRIDAAISTLRQLREEIENQDVSESVLNSSRYELNRMLVSLENLRHITQAQRK